MAEDDSPSAFDEEGARYEEALTLSGEDSGSIEPTAGPDDRRDLESTTGDENAVPPALEEDPTALDEREDEEESFGKS